MKFRSSSLHFFAFAVLSTFLLASCGDDTSSGAFLDRDDDGSVSSDESSSGKAGSSSSGKSGSSSSGKSSSSSSGKSGSSSSGTLSSSSSGKAGSSSGNSSSSVTSSGASSSSVRSSSSVASSSSKPQSSSSVYETWSFTKEELFNKEIVYGELRDARDGQVYKTLEIEGMVIMAENLNYADSATTPSLKGNSWCFGNVPENCAVGGRLYTWAAAIDSVGLLQDPGSPQLCGNIRDCSLPDVVQGICPDGWHLPDDWEFNSLQKLMDNDWITPKGWGSSTGGNTMGLSVIAGGYKSGDNFYGNGTTANFWSTTQYGSSPESMAYGLRFSKSSSKSISLYDYKKAAALSVRCVQNKTYARTFDINLPKELYFNPDVDYGTLTDARDGHVYKTVRIGKQTWMAENLNYEYAPLPRQNTCYNKDHRKCSISGRYYTWAAAIDSVALAKKGVTCGVETKETCKIPSFVQGVCPAGWHLPTRAEWDTLFNKASEIDSAGIVLKSRYGWNGRGYGSNALGFSAVAFGDIDDDSDFMNVGAKAAFWTTSYQEAAWLAQSSKRYWFDTSTWDSFYDISYLLAVRCVQDEEPE